MTDIPTYHVLALSGGGYRGLYTATVLAELETVLSGPIASHFDLICGTSAGGMLALGLAAEIPAHELKALFEEQGSRIFGRRSLPRRLLGFWLTAKHDSTGLREVLTERFQGTTIRRPEASCSRAGCQLLDGSRTVLQDSSPSFLRVGSSHEGC